MRPREASWAGLGSHGATGPAVSQDVSHDDLWLCPCVHRPDFLKQMFRWAVQYGQPDRDESPNRPAMRVEVIDISPTLSIGFTIAFLKYTEAGCVGIRAVASQLPQLSACD
jgi:hypothetical protein